MFIDSHAHLDSPAFREDLEQVLQRAAAAQVDQILSIGCLRNGLEDWEPLGGILEETPQLLAAAGVHPHDASHFHPRLGEQILQLMQHPRVVAWGEIGLDFHYDHSPRSRQEEAFRAQIRLAREAGKPVIIHNREADQETCRILEEEYPPGVEGSGVLHCFTGSLEMAERCLQRGFYVSVGGILTFKNGEPLQDTVRRLPPDRLLLETDSPYLAPVPYRGKRNEPAFVVKVAETLAKLLGMTLPEVARLTSQNFRRLFPDSLANPE